VHAIEDALARISHLQPVQLGPSGLNVASQQIHIEALPPVLVLHLKRFLYDAIADGIVKISKPVKFASELEIPLGTLLSFAFPMLAWLRIPCGPEIMAPVVAKSAESAHYKLYGVLYHHGKSTGSGHYTVDVLHQNGDSGGGEGWLHIDDESVGAVRHEDVFVFGGYGNERVDDRCAYMLFYCRTASAWT
jgi:ubiquitin carboxyl-terminal hydrolase 10